MSTLDDINAALRDVWEQGGANKLFIPVKTYIHLRRPFMTRRGYRRWRARMRAWVKSTKESKRETRTP